MAGSASGLQGAFRGGAGRFTTSAVTALGASATCHVAASVSTNLVVDVVGCYR